MTVIPGPHFGESGLAASSMRVALVSPGFPPDLGGVETVVGHLSAGLANRGHRVAVLAHRRRSGRHLPSHAPTGVDVRRFPDWTGSRRFEVAPGLWRELRRGQVFDVVHAHSFHASAALAASTASRAPLVFSPHYHGVGHTTAARIIHRLYDPLAARIFVRAERVVCVSAAEQAAVCRDYPAASGKTVVIPNGVNVDALSRAEPYALERPVVLSVGRLEEYKQVALTIRAFAWLPSTEPILVIAGKGPERAALERLAAELGVAARVRFLGYVADDALRRWQRSAAVTVTLSRHEAFGLIMLEAVAAGSRVVASAIPAHLEVGAAAADVVDFVAANESTAAVAEVIQNALLAGPSATQPRDIPTWEDVSRRTETVLRLAASTGGTTL